MSTKIPVMDDHEDQYHNATSKVAPVFNTRTPTRDIKWDNEGRKHQSPVTLVDRLGYEQFFSARYNDLEPNPITLRDRLGLDDFSSPKVWRMAVAELLGTGVLVFLIDAIVISQNGRDGEGESNLTKSILIAIIVSVLVLVTFPVSGGHLNPISSFTAGLIGLISLSRALIYILAQCFGAVLGALALKYATSASIVHYSSLGGCTIVIVTTGPDGPIATRLETAQALCLEIVCPFIFLFASRWVSFDPNQLAILGRLMVCLSVGLGVGLNVLVSATVTGVKGYSGAGINPARCLGPAIVRGGYLWNGHWIFWVGPVIACMGFYLYTRIIPDDDFRPEKSKHDFLNILKAVIVPDAAGKGQ